METRREFIKKASLLSGGAGLWSALPASVQRALAIDPQPGSTYMDAEHIVLLMQENRSFDHCFGALQGVRGFNDPRAITLPGRNLVWLQTGPDGNTYAPFRLDLKDTKATWMSSLPHSWENQVDARNNGKYNRWLEVKPSGNEEYAKMPLTLGYHTREDIPFYYALADAFTVCDQHFCSSLTGTTPNRLYFWTGTIRDQQSGNVPANVRNSEVDYDRNVHWTTFPERLEENGISWKIYQNEISIPSGLQPEEDSWLANFTDNPLEWFSQYGVGFYPKHQAYLRQQETALSAEIQALQANNSAAGSTKELKEKLAALDKVRAARQQWSAENFEKFSQKNRQLHQKAFTTNEHDRAHRQLTTLTYQDGDTERNMQIPKGDVLHQFREDVKRGQLPTVSWLVAPERFSDHPGAPWYGAWYVSEVLDILTKNPEVWKKTVFILTYDENDGWFDHVPPFVAPDPRKPDTGAVSKGIDTAPEFVTKEQELQKGVPPEDARDSPIGLGYRVPLVIASPWSRGGWVCSQVFDHTSPLQFLEKFISHKTGKQIRETNITAWRRTVCGDLSSVFRPYNGEKINTPGFPDRNTFLESIYNAKFKRLPTDYKALSREEVEQINRNPRSSSLMPRQEAGIRSACALPYELHAEGQLSDDRKAFNIRMEAGNTLFGAAASGAPFLVYAPGKYGQEETRSWNYAVAAGDSLTGAWPLQDFENNIYHLRLYGPNGFFREFTGNAQDPQVSITCRYLSSAGHLELHLENHDPQHSISIEIKDHAYGLPAIAKKLAPGAKTGILLNLARSHGWYDCSVHINGYEHFEKRYAGHIETGQASHTDPLMGRVKI